MKAVLTGGSGFLGGYIYAALQRAGFDIFRVGRSVSNEVSCDLANQVPNLSFLSESFVVVHAAGKAHTVPSNESEAKAFFQTNVEGTRHLLQALENLRPEGFVFISSVSVYGKETGVGIRESDELAGSSPYAKSKIEAEQLIQRWCSAKGIPCLILRLPLVVGHTPPGNLGKMIKGIRSGKYFSIGGGKARRSMVLAEDVGIVAATCYNISGVFNLTDGRHPRFRDMEQTICRQLNKAIPLSIPMLPARILGFIGGLIPKSPVNRNTISKMTQDLTFDDSKARKELNWSPRSAIDFFSI
jgi:nucleoside-diphosphate-sugar epimerase